MKQSKQIYYTKYFENNWNNINITITVPQLIEFNNRTIINPTAMSNVFNNYFTSIAKELTLISNFHQNITQTTYLIQTQIPFPRLQLTKMKYLL